MFGHGGMPRYAPFQMRSHPSDDEDATRLGRHRPIWRVRALRHRGLARLPAQVVPRSTRPSPQTCVRVPACSSTSAPWSPTCSDENPTMAYVSGSGEEEDAVDVSQLWAFACGSLPLPARHGVLALPVHPVPPRGVAEGQCTPSTSSSLSSSEVGLTSGRLAPGPLALIGDGCGARGCTSCWGRGVRWVWCVRASDGTGMGASGR